MSYDIECPYCDHSYFYEDRYMLEDGDVLEEQCPACNKIFQCDVYCAFSFSARETPCKNGAPHKWGLTCIENRYHCRYCSETTEMTKEEFNKLGG